MTTTRDNLVGDGARVIGADILDDDGKAAALELAPRGIRVNIVHPGPIDTPILDDADPVFILSRRLDGNRAKCAVARSILIIIWHLLANPAARFTDLG